MRGARAADDDAAASGAGGGGASSSGAPSALERAARQPAVAARAAEDERFNYVWPLHTLDVADREHADVIWRLLRAEPLVAQAYLDDFVFPQTLEFRPHKLSASGQELGGALLFERTRCGFSGTPSDLLPEEFGHCQYAPGDDARMIATLTSAATVAVERLGDAWSPAEVLRRVARARPAHHALIDTGALVTGYTNAEVAATLLDVGLDGFDGVVYLDEADRKMILVRAGRRVMRLEQCGVARERRFTFYDQTHTTGMDIKQPLACSAVVTLGKDMTWRDFAQGAYRMRGIGKGQTIALYVIPEVAKLVEAESAAGAAPAAPAASPFASPAEAARRELCDVAAWLHVNAMRAETLQFNLLCEQSVRNVWRKAAYRNLIDLYDADRDGGGGGGAGGSRTVKGNW